MRARSEWNKIRARSEWNKMRARSEWNKLRARSEWNRMRPRSEWNQCAPDQNGTKMRPFRMEKNASKHGSNNQASNKLHFSKIFNHFLINVSSSFWCQIGLNVGPKVMVGFKHEGPRTRSRKDAMFIGQLHLFPQHFSVGCVAWGCAVWWVPLHVVGCTKILRTSPKSSWEDLQNWVVEGLMLASQDRFTSEN